jgi:cytochrome c oxidase subunit 2
MRGRGIAVRHQSRLRRGGTTGKGALLAILAAVALAAAAVALSGCTAPSMFSPHSPGAHDIRTLSITIFAILSGVLLTVWVLLAIVIIRYRRRPESEVKQTAGNLKIEIVWTIIPAIIVAVLFVLTMRTTGQLAIARGNLNLTVTGHQWWWQVQYTGARFETANEIHVPVDQTVTADLKSADVIHSFWIPELSGKVDMNPGHVNHIGFVPMQTGTYLGECSEYCGQEHARMRFLLVVETPQQFTAWIDNQEKPAAQPTGAAAVAGAQLIGQLPCAGCHTIRGTSVQGTLCPDLTHFGSRQGIAEFTLTNTPQNLRRWLADPQTVKPGAIMPYIPLASFQLDELVAYLEELK